MPKSSCTRGTAHGSPHRAAGENSGDRLRHGQPEHSPRAIWCHVAGIDVSATAITAAAERARATGAAADVFQVGDVTRPHSLRGLGEFDCVIDGLCWHCIHRRSRSRLLTMVRGVLRPAGCFLAVTMFGDPRSAILRNRFDPATRLIVSGDIAQRHLGEAEALLTELRAAGFEIAYERRVAGRDDTGDQDMLLAVARSKQPE